MSVRDDLDPATLVRAGDTMAPCVFCGLLTKGRSTGEGAEPVHWMCMFPRMWLDLAVQRGAIEVETSWGNDTKLPPSP